MSPYYTLAKRCSNPEMRVRYAIRSWRMRQQLENKKSSAPTEPWKDMIPGFSLNELGW
jgi:hypothetical protein